MIRKMYLAVMALGLLSVSCSSDDDTPQVETSALTLNLSGLEALGSDYVYEGWVIVNGNPVSTGTFSDVTFPQTFQVESSQLAAATTFVLSIEPAVDTDPAPADTKILAGDFSGTSASVNSNGIVADFSASTGEYILATPTDDDMTNESSGVWFLNNSGAAPVAGLDLPTLPAGWKYEGWAVVDGTPLSTGTFTNVAAADEFSGFSGMNMSPPFPGEDFLFNEDGTPNMLNLLGQTIVISVEPSPDNSPAPFTLKPLAHMVPVTAALHTPITMGTGPVVTLMGTVSR
ncbi:anti-sigma factor [Olleya sp. R77988]|uniref:anti-sigma factor n=1 Tax=Olleya sp. R77988 TaxID=3093875 RepID=UPI0037C6701F